MRSIRSLSHAVAIHSALSAAAGLGGGLAQIIRVKAGNKYQPRNNDARPKDGRPGRQRRFRALFVKQFAAVKKEYGSGLCSYAEGMTRRAARRIARARARFLLPLSPPPRLMKGGR